MKFKYLGSYDADSFMTHMPNNTFQIVNTEGRNSPGRHWVMLAKSNNMLFYGDSMGRPLARYTNIAQRRKFGGEHGDVQVMNKYKIQQGPLCGLYCIYFALQLFNNYTNVCNDYDLLRILTPYLYN